MEFVLSASGLRKSYPTDRAGKTVYAVRDISLQVRAGETLAIVGESGCGKSTLARLLVGLEPPDSGNVQNASGARIPMVFQDSLGSLNPRRLVRDLILEPILIRGQRVRSTPKDHRVALDLAGAVGLQEEYLTRLPHQLSGGQRQRVNIARALAAEARVLVLDEPLSALDVSIQAQILNMLVELQEQRKIAVVLISHDLSVVRYFAHQTMVLYLGRVVESGPTAEIMERPRHPYTKTLLAADPSIRLGAPRNSMADLADGAADGGPQLESEPPSPYEVQEGCAFASRCPIADAGCRVKIPELLNFQNRAIACFKSDRAVD